MNTAQIVSILDIALRLEPAALTLFVAFAEKINGKTGEQLMGEADPIWKGILDKAKAQLAAAPVRP